MKENHGKSDNGSHFDGRIVSRLRKSDSLKKLNEEHNKDMEERYERKYEIKMN